MKKTILTTILILISLITFSQKSKLKDIKEKYEPYYEATNIKMGILVKKDGQFYSERLNFENNDNTVFNIGSATKTFTAVLILQELEKGNIELTDSIGKFLSPIKNISSDITIEQLLEFKSPI